MTRHVLFAMLMLSTLTSLAPPIAEATHVHLEMNDGGAPADGVYDVEISVFDAAEGGRLVDRWMVTEVAASSGRLSIPSHLDADTTGRDLWVEARVRESGRGPLEDVPGRVPLNAEKQLGVCEVDGTLSVNGAVGIGTTTPGSTLHIVAQSSPPLGLPADQNGLMLGSAANGDRWVQSYGGPLLLNGQGNPVGIGAVDPSVALNVNGLVKANGYLQPGSGGENLRILRGRIAADGSISHGSGFTVSKSSTGIYTVIPDQMFSGIPTVTATVFNAAGGRVSLSANAANQFEFTTWSAQGATADRDIEFIAVGNP
jgi:hypothetical protein